MSFDGRLYTCRFAPCGSTVRHAIRTAQVVVSNGDSAPETFTPQAFYDTPATDVPILLDHDPRKRAGTLRAKTAHKDWHHGDFILDGPCAELATEWIERSGKVSPGYTEIERDPVSNREPARMRWVTRATLDEISILPPGAIAWFEGAKITNVSELAAPKPAVRAASGNGEGEVYYGDGQRITRYGIGKVLRVR